ncbi:MAG TPA: AAA family ATPase [Firmicutes bacterium]|nr:AAA family ATPase [Bacillota bacterium]
MIVLIAGCSHTGKTLLAQRLLEKYAFPYLSIDHLKMGLIRSGNVALTPEDDDELEVYLWPIIREMIKTAIENHQNLVVEGCYIPFRWKEDFDQEYLKEIKYYCLIMTEKYIHEHFQEIKSFASVIEQRGDDSFCTKEMLLKENAKNLEMCKKYDCTYIEINDSYHLDIQLF